MAETRPTFDSAREKRLRFLLAEFALGVPSGKQFDCDEMRLLRDDLDAMLGEIDRLRDDACDPDAWGVVNKTGRLLPNLMSSSRIDVQARVDGFESFRCAWAPYTVVPLYRAAREQRAELDRVHEDAERMRESSQRRYGPHRYVMEAILKLAASPKGCTAPDVVRLTGTTLGSAKTSLYAQKKCGRIVVAKRGIPGHHYTIYRLAPRTRKRTMNDD